MPGRPRFVPRGIRSALRGWIVERRITLCEYRPVLTLAAPCDENIVESDSELGLISIAFDGDLIAAKFRHDCLQEGGGIRGSAASEDGHHGSELDLRVVDFVEVLPSGSD